MNPYFTGIYSIPLYDMIYIVWGFQSGIFRASSQTSPEQALFLRREVARREKRNLDVAAYVHCWYLGNAKYRPGIVVLCGLFR